MEAAMMTSRQVRCPLLCFLKFRPRFRRWKPLSYIDRKGVGNLKFKAKLKLPATKQSTPWKSEIDSDDRLQVDDGSEDVVTTVQSALQEYNLQTHTYVTVPARRRSGSDPRTLTTVSVTVAVTEWGQSGHTQWLTVTHSDSVTRCRRSRVNSAGTGQAGSRASCRHSIL